MVRNTVRAIFKFLLVGYIITSVCILLKMNSKDYKNAITQDKLIVKEQVNSTVVSSYNKTTKIWTTIRNSTMKTHTTALPITTTEKPMVKEPLFRNYRYIGPGANGTDVKIPPTVNKTKLGDYFSKKHGFNILVSDLIGAHRSFGDCRPQKCRDKTYPPDLPPASVVIIFRDEYPGIVLRTAYSVLETTPDYLLKDIVLVDDGSEDVELKMIVDIHVANVDKFHLVRNEKPLGLMMARQKGIEASLADYFVVMDSHMEVCTGWMEPLIYRLVQEPKALISPQVGGVNRDSLKIEINEYFDRNFMFLSQTSMGQVWVPYDTSYVHKRNGSVEPLIFPVMQGMILSMKKDFFFKLGGFDPGMRVWGTEQMEMSVKVWMCGGRVEIIPCSRVGHLFRVTPWGRTLNNYNHIASNRARFVAVWLDGKQKDIMLELQKGKGAVLADDIEERKAIRRNNNCKPYQYFLDQVKELARIFVPNNLQACGRIYNNFTGQCMDNIVEKKDDPGQIGTYPCHGADNQFFVWTENYEIRFDQHIMYVKPNGTQVFAMKTVLEINNPSAYFNYRSDNTIFHSVSGKCITASKKYVELLPCTGSSEQLWEWKRTKDTPDVTDLSVGVD